MAGYLTNGREAKKFLLIQDKEDKITGPIFSTPIELKIL
jgi:hypothetical protein